MGPAAIGADAGLPAWMRRTVGGFELALHVQPGARRRRVVGVHGDRLKLALSAPPVEGRANEELLALIAERLGLPRRAIRLEAGSAQRDKRVAVLTTLDAADLVARLVAD